MRALALAALVLLAAFPPAASQGAGPLLTDAKDDAKLTPDAAGSPVAGHAVPHDFAAQADLLSLGLAETEGTLTFTLAVALLKGDFVASFHDVLFSWAGTDYVLGMGYYRLQESSSNPGTLYRVQPDGSWDALAQARPAVDVEKGTLTTVLPKVYLMDEKGRAPARGDALEGVRVESESMPLNFGVAGGRFRDAMPDEGDGVTYVLVAGDYEAGSVSLVAPERVRVSNGGSTTFVYAVTVVNRAEAADEYTLAAPDAPEGWNVTVQSPLKVPGKGEKTIAVLATVPFAHDHGGFTAFNLTVQSRADPATQARMRLGVLHTPIPQPAGHHGELYLHPTPRNANPVNDVFNHVEPYGRPGMNTESSHEGDVAFASVNYQMDGKPGWWIPLTPGLRMGLDFDLERTGTLVGAVENAPPGAGTLTASLILVGEGDEEVVLAESDPYAVDVAPNAPFDFALTLTPREAADYVPYADGQNLVLVMRLDTERAVGYAPALRPRLLTEPFKLTLPLNEYHDRLDGVADAAAALELKAEGAVEKAGRPGTILTYVFALTNTGPTAERIALDAAGADSHRATVVPVGAFTLGPRETKRVTLAVSIPSDSAAGEELDVLLFAHGEDDPSKTAIARTKTRVSLGEDAVADESAVLIAAREAERPAPGFAVPLLVAALACALLLARRKQLSR